MALAAHKHFTDEGFMNPAQVAIENIESSIQECTAGINLFDNSINIRAEVSALARMGEHFDLSSDQFKLAIADLLHYAHSANRLMALRRHVLRLKARMKSDV